MIAFIIEKQKIPEKFFKINYRKKNTQKIYF